MSTVQGSTGFGGVEYHPPHEANRTRAVGAAARIEASPGAYGHAANVTTPPPSQDAARHASPGTRAVAGAFRVVGTRIDWLTVAFKTVLSMPILGELYDAVEAQQRTAFTFAGCEWELRKMRSGQRLLLRNADAAVVLDPQGPEGWTVQVEFPGAVMMRTDVDRAVEIARSVAAMLGTVNGERVRRLDLCADVAGLDVSGIAPSAFVKPSRARLERANVSALEKSFEHPDLRVRYKANAQVTGFTVCPGNALSAVVYDKPGELRQHERPDKAVMEERTWRANGWDGEAPVTRVEFRLRSEVLHELGARDGLDAFRGKLDALWGYCARLWLRLVVPGTAERPSRCALDPAWATVRLVQFVHATPPGERVRIRGGASAAQAFGASLSHVAATDKQPPRYESLDETTGELRTVVETLAVMEDAQVADLVTARVSGIFEATARAVALDFVERLGLRGAAEFVLVREGAARARFSSADACGYAAAIRRAA